MTDEELRKVISKYIEVVHGTKTNAAKAWGCKLSYVSDVTNGRKPIPEWMLNKIGYARKIVRIK